ncbi:hypothetical protein EB796_022957 [Bugula neritina]|uniref:Uncharacterized protein n=1 Tax=Bugula neritina TaxID=10212 RepID=A0A7J7IXT1_BUGNE|nr:hypothetical protein EB796_022957 [Bugula neritina]
MLNALCLLMFFTILSILTLDVVSYMCNAMSIAINVPTKYMLILAAFPLQCMIHIHQLVTERARLIMMYSRLITYLYAQFLHYNERLLVAL